MKKMQARDVLITARSRDRVSLQFPCIRTNYCSYFGTLKPMFGALRGFLHARAHGMVCATDMSRHRKDMFTVWLLYLILDALKLYIILFLSTFECSSKKRIDEPKRKKRRKSRKKTKKKKLNNNKMKKKKKRGRHQTTQRITMLATHLLKSKTKAKATQ